MPKKDAIKEKLRKPKGGKNQHPDHKRDTEIGAGEDGGRVRRSSSKMHEKRHT